MRDRYLPPETGSGQPFPLNTSSSGSIATHVPAIMSSEPRPSRPVVPHGMLATYWNWMLDRLSLRSWRKRADYSGCRFTAPPRFGSDVSSLNFI